MNVLVINTGSSSLKYQLISMKTQKLKAKGLCDRIGMAGSVIKHSKNSDKPIYIDIELKDHRVAMKEVLALLTDKNLGVIGNVSEIYAVGHRVVHGGEKFYDSVVIDDNVIEIIKECIDLAPLHNPANIIGIEACKEIMGNIPMVAVFDTAFHQTMPMHAFLYAIAYELYEKYGIRKYGFHGTSHKYVAKKTAEFLNKPLEELKLITCHLGNGASICAIKNGKSIDTSMGFTPLAGLAMGTRSGSIDPAVITYLMEKEHLDQDEINNLLNKKSGLLGISGISSDFRDLDAAAALGHKRAKLAIDIFCYRVKKYISEYIGVLEGADAIIFTAGIGENNAAVREEIMAGLGYFGATIDVEKNKDCREEADISSPDARIKTLIIPTNEELEIARECQKLLGI